MMAVIGIACVVYGFCMARKHPAIGWCLCVFGSGMLTAVGKIY